MQHRAIVLCTLLFSAVSLFAQSSAPQICPVRIDKLSPSENGLAENWYTNVSNKPISAVVTHLAVYNAVHDELTYIPASTGGHLENPKYPKYIEQTQRFTHTFTPGKRSRFSAGLSEVWSIQNTYAGESVTYDTWVYGVLFADGSIWKDDGSHSCSASTIP